MRPLIEFLSDLRSLGVVLTLDGERLICNAPKGALTPERRNELAERKSKILAFLRVSQSPQGSIHDRTALTDLPLARAQQRLWFLAQFDTKNPVYNIVIALRMTGELNRQAFEQSLRVLVERHEALRTSFYEDHGKPRARIVEIINWRSEYVDLSSSSLDEAERKTMDLAHEEARRPFALENGPLFRATIFEISKTSYLLMIVVHHIVADGWSLGILAKELGQLYIAFAANQTPVLDEISFQYRDFVRWEQDAGEKAAARQMPFWLERLAGTLQILELPSDRRRPPVQTFAGKRISIRLEAALANKIKELSRQTGSTPYMLMLAAFKALLFRYTGVEDILVGSGASNRQMQEVVPLVGFFVTNLVMRTDLSGNPSFLDLLARVKETALTAYEHQDVPFDLLIERLQPERGLNHSPLVQVMFTFQNIPIPKISLPQLVVTMEHADPGIARADLNVEIWPEDQEFRCDFEYNTDLFDESTMRAMQSHYQAFLEGALADPSLRIGNIPLLSAAERRKLLVEWNATDAEYPNLPAHTLFEQYAKNTPDAIGLRSSNVEISYGALNRMANAIAHQLHAYALPEHSFVAVVATGTAAITAFLGILKAGHAYVPVDANETPERFAAVLAAAEASVLLTMETLLPLFGTFNIPHLDAIERLLAGETDVNPHVDVKSHDPAYLMFTSGSTGVPKGVVIPHRAIVRLVKNTDYIRLAADEVILQVLPLSFDPSTLDIYGALLNGGTLAMLEGEQRDPSEIAAAIQKLGVTTLVLTSAFFHFMVEHHLEMFRPLRQLLIGGDVLSPAHVARVKQELPHLHLINGYGPTENATLTCCHTVGERPLAGAAALPIGRPIHNTRVYILDEFQQPVPRGVSGELYAAGDGLALGYLNDSLQTAEKFVMLKFKETGPVRAYRTGDIARYRTDGAIEFMGRKDKQIKLRGYRIELAEVEQALLTLPYVRDAVSTLRSTPKGDRKLVAYLVFTDDVEGDTQQLRIDLRKILPPHAVPEDFLTIEAIPWTSNGKVDYEVLDRIPLDTRNTRQNLSLPTTDTERKLTLLFAELLQIKSASKYDDFFALGGHSLLVKELIARVADLFHVTLPVASVFQNSTVEALSRELDVALAASGRKILLASDKIKSQPEHPVSRSQLRLWFLDQLDPGNPVYNNAVALRISGPVKHEALGDALKTIVGRHESLRTCFLQRDGHPYALVKEGADWQMAVIDRSELSEQTVDLEMIRLTQEEYSKPFQLQRGPLFRASLIRKSEEEHILVLVMHHIISDGWSLGILSQELGSLYRTNVRHGGSASLPPAMQFRDFVAWEQSESERSSGADMAYWQKQLSGELIPLELTTDHRRPPQQSFRGRWVTGYISSALVERLQRLSRGHNATLFMSLFAALTVLLQKYSGQHDILVGTPTAGRSRTEFEGVIGFFVNNLVIRTDLSGNPEFSELLRRVQRTTLEAFDHQSVPFNQIVEVLQPERRLDRSPIFQVMFTLQNVSIPAMRLDTLETHPVDLQGIRARYDLSIDVYPSDDRYRCDFEYNMDIFDESTVQQMLHHYLRLLEEILDDPTVVLDNLLQLDSVERRQIVEEWNATETPAGRYTTVPEWFRAQAARSPEAIALEMGQRHLTYSTLDRQSNRFAAVLRSHSAGQKTIVGIYLRRSPEMVVALLGILKSGNAYLPIDPALPAQRIEFLLRDAGVSLMVTQRDLRHTLKDFTGTLLELDSLGRDDLNTAEAHSDGLIEGGLSADDLAYLIYTSGSTGEPKGAEITQGALVNLLSSMLREPGLSSSDTLVAITTLSFDIAALEIFGPLLCGAKLVLASREQVLDPEALAHLIEQSGATVMQATPSVWRIMVESGWMGQANLRMWCGGESLASDLAASLMERGRELWNLYGPTETTIWSAAHRVRSGEDPILIGKPIANTRMYILDPRGEPVPLGISGELYVAGAGVARGYWRRPELTAARFIADPFDPVKDRRMYRTGDRARYRRDGQIQLIGRTDAQIKLRGHRIELGEIEVVLGRNEDVLQAVVVLHEEGASQQLIAYVKLVNDGVDILHLRSWTQARLPEYMVPTLFFPMNEIPLTPNGKVDRKRLPSPTLAPRDISTPVLNPRNRMEKRLVALWCEILGVDHVGIRDNFFDIGGHSLLLIRVHARLRQEVDVDIAVVDLFRYPTIESMASWLEHQQQELAMSSGPRA